MYSEIDSSLPFGLDNPTPEYHNFSVAPVHLTYSQDKAIYWAKFGVRRAYMSFCKNNPL